MSTFKSIMHLFPVFKNTKKRKPVTCLRMLLKSTPLQPETSRAPPSFISGARVASVASVGTLPIGIIQQQARFRCGHGCFSRRAFLFPFFPYFDRDRSVTTHAHVLPFLTTLRCRKTRSAGADYCRLNLQEWFTGTFRVLLPPGNNFKPLWPQRRSTCLRSEPSKRKRRR